jgi:integrase
MYATLQREEDVLLLGPSNIRRDNNNTRFLHIVQRKFGTVVNIEITPEIESLIQRARDSGTVIHKTFVRRQDGQPYTQSGISTMWQRARNKAGIKDFGPRDLRGKAATDMYEAGEPLEKIQRLLGHADISTTQIYIKRYESNIVCATTTSITKLKVAGQ